MNQKQKNQISKEIQAVIDKTVDKAIHKAFFAGQTAINEEIKNYYQHLENRLAAHPQLILNVEKYDRDIEDLLREGKAPQKSKDICFMPGSGIRLTEEQKLEAKILSLQRRKIIDQEEINEIKSALELIKDDEYYMIVEYKYFFNYADDKIAELIPCDTTTVWRNRGRLLRQMMIKLYGANALKTQSKTSYRKGKK